MLFADRELLLDAFNQNPVTNLLLRLPHQNVHLRLPLTYLLVERKFSVRVGNLSRLVGPVENAERTLYHRLPLAAASSVVEHALVDAVGH